MRAGRGLAAMFRRVSFAATGPARPGAAAALTISIALAVGPTSAPAWAQTPWYQVEVVIFAEGGDEAWERDDWREAGPPPIEGNTVELLARLSPSDAAGGTGRRHAFRTLPASALDLGAAVNRLDGSSDHRVILHVGWQQPGFRDEDAPAVHLSTLGGVAPRPRLDAATGVAEVDGTVRVWRRRFLHVHADLAFGEIDAWRERHVPSAAPREEGDGAREAGGGRGDLATAAPAVAAPTRTLLPERAAPADGRARSDPPRAPRSGPLPEGARPLRVARLSRTLRLRTGRLHYVDHPVFGILLLVKRLH